MVRLNGPRTTEDLCEGVLNRNVDLTPFTRECASLWRVLYGSRRGHFNQKAVDAAAGKRKRVLGVYKNAQLGVLAAARLAVASKRMRRARASAFGEETAGSSAVHAGAGTDKSRLWSAALGNFQERTSHNIASVTQLRAHRGAAFLQPPGIKLDKQRGARMEPLARKRPRNQVAFLDDECEVQGPGVMKVYGIHRCAGAGIAIVPDLAFLDDVEAILANIEYVVSYIYIVLLGELVATNAQLLAVGADPRRLPKDRCVSHIAASGAKTLTFWLDPALRRDHRDVFRAFRRVAQEEKSLCSVSDGKAPGDGAIVFRDLRDVVQWTRSQRRVENVMGPKVFTVGGVPLPN